MALFPFFTFLFFLLDWIDLSDSNRSYEKINIHGQDSPTQLKKLKCKIGSRLKLLRRTLHERSHLAGLVRQLHVPGIDNFSFRPAREDPLITQYIDLVASVVMECPNLERMTGLALPYNHGFDRLSYALSKRKKLKEHVWAITENESVRKRSSVAEIQVTQFLSYHQLWSELETLVLHSHESKGTLDARTFSRIFDFLPSLRHLSVSYFDSYDFSDDTLAFLPGTLESLRLDNMLGITGPGLIRYCSREDTANNLKTLTLVEQNIVSILILSRIFSLLKVLKSFAISQSQVSLFLPEDEDPIPQPILKSRTLSRLHWDVCSPNGPAFVSHNLTPKDAIPSIDSINKSTSPNGLLAQSILHAGFSSLEWLRAPRDVDPLGALQSVCRPAPKGQIMTAKDQYSLPRKSTPHGQGLGRGGSLSDRFGRVQAMPSGNHLISARIRAQTLIDMAACSNAQGASEGMKVVITDHSNQPAEGPEHMHPRLQPMLDDDFNFNPGGGSAMMMHDSFGELENAHIFEQSPNFSPDRPREFAISPFLGRTGYWSAAHKSHLGSIPHFRLCPDVPGLETDGGIVSLKSYLTANRTLSVMDLLSDLSETFSEDELPRPPLLSSGGPPSRSGSRPSSPSSPRMPGLGGPGRSLTNIGEGRKLTLDVKNLSGPNSGNNKTGFSSFSPSSSKPFFRSSPTQQQMPAWGSPFGGSGSFSWQDTCTGHWNHGHKDGRDWWQHHERDRPYGGSSHKPIPLSKLFS